MAYDELTQLLNYLIFRAKAKELTTYSEIANVLGTSPRAVGKMLWRFNEVYNNPHWPIITSIIVNKNTLKPGDGLWALFPGISDAEKQGKWIELINEVYAFDWDQALRDI